MRPGLGKVSFRRLPPAAAACVLIAAALLGGCRSASINESSVEQANQRPPTQPLSGGLPAVPVIGSADYRVGPLDVLDVEVFGVPDLTRSVRISVAGEFTMPLVGTVPASLGTYLALQKLTSSSTTTPLSSTTAGRKSGRPIPGRGATSRGRAGAKPSRRKRTFPGRRADGPLQERPDHAPRRCFPAR